MRSTWQLVIFLLLLTGMFVRGHDRELLRRNLLGKIPPEIAGPKEHWLGKAEPTTLAAQRGHVVWLQFNF